jgi:hypothetical protein
LVVPLLAVASAGCTGGSDADRIGVGAECSTQAPCPDDEDSDTPELECLTQFDGGYCGLSDCTGNEDCPETSACVAHTDGSNYCFRLCVDKPECNVNRSEGNESNCSSNVVFVDASTDSKACVPPSSGD